MARESKSSRAGKPRWWLRIFLAGCLVLVILLAIAPWIVARTSVRNQFLTMLVDDPAIQIASESASFGYFSPVSIDGLHITADEGRTNVHIAKIETGKSWLSMLMDRPELGTFTFRQPAVNLIVGEKWTGESSDVPETGGPLPQLTAVIEDGSVTVREPLADRPAVDLQHINVTFHLQRETDGALLVVDPVTVFDHQKLTPDICHQGLQLVAPLLADELSVQGEFSFELKRLHIPIDRASAGGDQDPEVAGVIRLHNASVSLKKTVVGQLIKLTTRLLGAQQEERMTVAQDSAVEFHLADGLVHHKGLALMLPHRESAIQLRSSGTVTLDGQLDVQVEIDLPGDSLGESKLAKHLVDQPIVIQVRGTLDKPEFALADDPEWSGKLAELLTLTETDEEAGRVAGRTIGLLNELLSGNSDEETADQHKGIIDRLREAGQRRKNKDRKR